MPSPLPEIREENASPELRRIYADMRRSMHLPLVNLIYRYFATVPGVLPHVWSWVREMVLSGELDAALARLKRNLSLPRVAPFEGYASSLSGADLAAIKCVIDAYNRGNGLNLIALTAVRLDLHRRAHDAPDIGAVPPDESAPSIPRLLKLAELPKDVIDRVTTMARLHDAGSDVIPSLYLHLANWPEFLTAVCDRIAPLLRDGTIARARQTAVDLADAEAKALVALRHGVAEVAGLPDEVMATLQRFTTRVIPDMLPVGLVLDDAWAARDSG